jgi:hypothetical protein
MQDTGLGTKQSFRKTCSSRDMGVWRNRASIRARLQQLQCIIATPRATCAGWCDLSKYTEVQWVQHIHELPRACTHAPLVKLWRRDETAAVSKLHSQSVCAISRGSNLLNHTSMGTDRPPFGADGAHDDVPLLVMEQHHVSCQQHLTWSRGRVCAVRCTVRAHQWPKSAGEHLAWNVSRACWCVPHCRCWRL